MIKKCLVLAVGASQIFIAAGAAAAADLDGASPFANAQRGAFAGIRLRAAPGEERPYLRASLTVAPTTHSRVGANARLAMGEGLDLTLSPSRKPEITLAGQRLDRISLFDRPAERDRANMSTLAKVAIVAGVVVIVGTVAFAHVVSEASCFHGGSDGDC